jgi:CDP-diacylglycerol---serine O-phosphatidyltransferase
VVLAKKRVGRTRRSVNRRRLMKKGLSLLPNIFTLSNAFFGFCSIIFTAKQDFFAASYFILLGALMDALDGRIARLIGASSEIGLQLDSLADAISFCLAPAFLIYFWQLNTFGFFGLLISASFFLAGILRLARFNVIASQQTIFFLGLPTTIAGCFLAIFYLNVNFKYKDKYLSLVVLFLSLILSFLMVSDVKFPAFKQKLFNLNKNWHKVAFIFLFAIVFVLQFYKFLLFLFLLYFASSLIFNFKFQD